MCCNFALNKNICGSCSLTFCIWLSKSAPFFFHVKDYGAFYFCFGAGVQCCQRSALKLAQTEAGEPPKLLLGGSVPLYFKKPLGIMTGSLPAI